MQIFLLKNCLLFGLEISSHNPRRVLTAQMNSLRYKKEKGAFNLSICNWPIA